MIDSLANYNEYTVVLTACIDPGSGPATVVRKDPSVRLEDYRRSLIFWLSHPDPRLSSILFVDNSGYELSTLQEVARLNNPRAKDIEFLQLNDNNYPAYVDYGYPELRMLDETIARSRLARRAKYLIKVTGRLTFPGISRLLDSLPADYLFAVDCRIPVLPTGNPPWVYPTLMIFSSDFYKQHLLDLKSRMNDVLSNVETLLYLKLMNYCAEPGAILRWPVHISPLGYGAHSGRSYNTPRRKFMDAVRTASRVVCPRLWI